MSPKIKNRGVAWLKREVNALLDTWAAQEIQEQLAGRLHNMVIYEKISRRLKELGFDRTGEQCREKIKKLRRDYKIMVQNNYSPVYARRLLGFREKVHKIFGKTPNLSELTRTDDINAVSKNCVNTEGDDARDTVIKSEVNTKVGIAANKVTIMSDNFFKNSPGRNEKFNALESLEFIKNAGNEFSGADEKMLLCIYDNCIAFQETLQKRQVSLNNKFMELEHCRTDNEIIENERKRLVLVENQREAAKTQKLELYKTLLQILANKYELQIKL